MTRNRSFSGQGQRWKTRADRRWYSTVCSSPSLADSLFSSVG